MKGSNERKLNHHACRVLLTVLLCIIWFNSHGQNCDYSTGTISFVATGGNNTDTYSTSYVLTNQQGTILRISNQTQFEILSEGFYSVYPVNYKITDAPQNLVQDENILNVTGSCLAIGAPYSFTVCEEIDNCNYCFGEDVELISTGGNTEPGFVTEYFLTNHSGEILVIQDNIEFNDLDVGSYIAFAINYDPAKTLTGFTVGSLVTDVQGGCKEISEGLIIGICQSLDPTIFFDLKSCDITQTALLQVGEVYDSYEWNTGSTSDFIIVDANLPATYRVTVTLASGCQGIIEQEITGQESSSIGDFVFEDLNGNGVQDESDQGLNGITVNLYTDFNRDGNPDFPTIPSCTTTTTNHPDTGLPGYYLFNVYRSNYVVEFVAPPGYELTFQDEGNDDTDSDANEDGFTASIGVLQDEHLINIDAGFTATSSAGGFVWNDADGDGVQDDGEEGFNDAIVNLYNPDGSLVATTVSITDPGSGLDGFYCFDNLLPGNYYTEIELPEGFILSPAMATGNTSKDSNANGENGPNTTPVFSVAPGLKQTGIDFGIYTGATLCGIVWRDSIQGNAGIYDEGVDMLLSTVQVSLLSLDLDETVQIINTDENGAYCFSGVNLGSYAIAFFGNSLPTFVTPGVGNDENIDSDVNTTTGRTPAFFVSPGDTILGLNAGITQPALPVDLVSFDGFHDLIKDVNALSWSTATEINNDYFDIQRATDQSNSFVNIGRVKGTGNSSSIVDYDYEDADIAASGTYYYRLKQVDFNGAFEYSDIIAIAIDRSKSLDWNIYPNPASDQIVVNLRLFDPSTLHFMLTDITGRIIMEWPLSSVEKGNAQVKLSLEEVAGGSYFLHIKTDNRTVNKYVQVIK